MTYINNGPLDGMDYRNIIPLLNDKNTKDILNDITNQSKNNIVVSEIKHGKLEKIKEISNKLSFYWLLMKEKKASENEIKLYNYLYEKIETIINQLIVVKRNGENKKSLLHLMFYNKYQIEDIESFTKFYYKLSFTKNNYCSNVIGKKSTLDKPNIQKTNIEQEVLDTRDIKLFISNFNGDALNEDEIENIAKRIYKLNKWTNFSK